MNGSLRDLTHRGAGREDAANPISPERMGASPATQVRLRARYPPTARALEEGAVACDLARGYAGGEASGKGN